MIYVKKALVFGIIVLFLGVGFQPALADEISTNIVSDVEEDCLECQPVNRVELLKVKLLLIRIEAFTNVILSRYGHIPEIREKCEEASERISEIILQDNTVICNLLLITGIFVVAIAELIDMILNLFKQGSPLYILILTLNNLFFFSFALTIAELLEYYDCDLFYP